MSSFFLCPCSVSLRIGKYKKDEEDARLGDDLENPGRIKYDMARLITLLMYLWDGNPGFSVTKGN